MKNNSGKENLTNKILGILELDRSVIELLLDDIAIHSLTFKKDEQNIIELNITLKGLDNKNFNVIGNYSKSFLFAKMGTEAIYNHIMQNIILPAAKENGVIK